MKNKNIKIYKQNIENTGELLNNHSCKVRDMENKNGKYLKIQSATLI